MPKINCPLCGALVTVSATRRVPDHADARERFHGRACPGAGLVVAAPIASLEEQPVAQAPADPAPAKVKKLPLAAPKEENNP
jgi:hypothetical protein